jgi:hypothetical protein
VSARKAIRLAQFSRRLVLQEPRCDQSALRLRIREIANARPRLGTCGSSDAVVRLAGEQEARLPLVSP